MRLQIIKEIRKGEPVSDIRRTLSYRADMFGEPFSACLQYLLRGPSDWSVGERELFASFTASRLQCVYWTGAHGAVAAQAISDLFVQEVLSDWRSAPINAQLRAMLGLLEKVTLDPDSVTPDNIRTVLTTGVSKQAIEDALRICACFNIISRIADAFDVTIPSAEGFTQTGIQLIAHGYI